MLNNVSVSTKEYIDKLIKSDRLGHAYLIVGRDSEIASETADYFANCVIETGGGVPADNIMVVEGEGTNLNIKVESIDALRRRLMKRPLSGEYMVALIKGAERMNPQSQNKLLKILEEPIAGVVIILSTAVEEALLPTIRSRCGIIRSKNDVNSLMDGVNVFEDNGDEVDSEDDKIINATQDMISCAVESRCYYDLRPFIEIMTNKDVKKDSLIKALDVSEAVLRNAMLNSCNVSGVSLNESILYSKVSKITTELLIQIIMKIEVAKKYIYRDMSRANTIKLLALDIIDLEENI